MSSNGNTAADTGLLGDIQLHDLLQQGEGAAAIVNLPSSQTVDDDDADAADLESSLDKFEREFRQWEKQMDAAFDRLAAGSIARATILRCS